MMIRLEPGLPLAGRVTDASGKGIAGVRVVASPSPAGTGGLGQYSFPAVRVVSVADGSFSIDQLPAREVSVTASHKGYRGDTKKLMLAPGGANQVNLVLSEGAVIEGLVTLNGKPAPRTIVSVRWW